MDISALATTALATATPWLATIGTEATKGAASAAGKSAWEWVKGKLTSEAGKEAVADLEKAPSDDDNVTAVRAALAKYLKTNPAAAEELARLLGSGAPPAAQSQNVSGTDIQAVQADRGAKVTITRK